MSFAGLVKDFCDFVRPLVKGFGLVDAVLNGKVPFYGQLPIFPDHIVRGWQLVDVPEEGLVVRDVLKTQVLREHFFVERFFKLRVVQEAFDLRAKQQDVVFMVIVEGLDAEDIPCGEQSAAVAVVDDEREHPAQAVEQGGAPFLVAVEQDFGIGAVAEGMPGGAELLTEFVVVVDFAVEAQDKAVVFVVHGLRAVFQVDNGQAAEAEGDMTVGKESFGIGAAVGDGVGH